VYWFFGVLRALVMNPGTALITVRGAFLFVITTKHWRHLLASVISWLFLVLKIVSILIFSKCRKSNNVWFQFLEKIQRFCF
jgi:hypothetical protein